MCVVGGGLAGIVSAKELLCNGISDVVGFESAACLGGLWAGGNKVWKGLRLNTSAWMTEFSDVPVEVEEGKSSFLSAEGYRTYLDRYARETGVIEKV